MFAMKNTLVMWAALGMLLIVLMASSTTQAAVWISGSAPDWNQPYDYTPPPPPGPGGPGPWPNPIGNAMWRAWCAPTSASNLIGYWEDGTGASIADGQIFNASPNWAATAAWHDYNADGTNGRPLKNAALPASPTDIGWYMDTNNGGTNLRGNGADGHAGTYIKDMHLAVADYLAVRSPGWLKAARTQGRAGTNVFYTTNPAYPAVTHANPAAAFAEIRQEIDANRTLIISFNQWSLTQTAQTLAGAGPGESNNGGTYYTWNTYSGFGNPDPGGHGENWNDEDNGYGLGHAVTAVGYILATTADDKWQAAGLLGPTDWVIMHDNWTSTARNVIVPFDQGVFTHWVANTTVVPEPGTIVLLISAAIGWWAIRLWRKRIA